MSLFLLEKRTCRKQDVKHTLRKHHRCGFAACSFFPLVNATRVAYDRRNVAYLYAYPGAARRFDAVHQAVEIENFVVNPALRNASAAWRRTERHPRPSSRVSNDERGRKKIITEKGMENGEKIGVAGKDQGPSFRPRSINPTFQSLDRSEDERKREPGAWCAPRTIASTRNCKTVPSFVSKGPRGAYACNAVSPKSHRFLIRPATFSGHTNEINLNISFCANK